MGPADFIAKAHNLRKMLGGASHGRSSGEWQQRVPIPLQLMVTLTAISNSDAAAARYTMPAERRWDSGFHLACPDLLLVSGQAACARSVYSPRRASSRYSRRRRCSRSITRTRGFLQKVSCVRRALALWWPHAPSCTSHMTRNSIDIDLLLLVHLTTVGTVEPAHVQQCVIPLPNIMCSQWLPVENLPLFTGAARIPGVILDVSEVESNIVFFRLAEGMPPIAAVLDRLKTAGVLMITMRGGIRAVTHLQVNPSPVP